MINLRGLDCVTFCETSLALARTLQRGGRTVRQFGRQIEAIRYRGGVRNGYPSRLHYFEDWMEDNAARGHMHLMSAALGGEPYVKTIDFMTTHRGDYPVLARDDAAYAAVREQEAALNARPRFYIPKERVAAVAGGIATGDILAVTTAVPGLLVSHTGLAYRTREGALHMLHAPITGYPVTITAEPLPEYLMAIPRDTGVMVARPI
jgi:hypothetical protein